MKKIILFLLLAIIFNSSFINRSKDPKTLNVVDKSKCAFDTIENPYYLLNYPFEVYKDNFIERLESGIEKNHLTIADPDTKVIDYTLTLKKISYTESIDPKTVNDTSSENNGESLPTQTCSMKVETSLYNSKAELIADFTATADEYETTIRNKNNADYMIKTLPDNIFIRLAKNCAISTVEQVLKKIPKK